MQLISKINKFHYKKYKFTALSIVLTPISFIYFLIINIKNLLYKIKILKEKKIDIPIICIGNLTTGGVGKTPIVIEIAKYLESIGEKPAIITRGYKGRLSNSNVNIIKDFNSILIDNPILSGDEPNLIAHSVNSSAVLVGVNRYKLAKYAQEMGATKIIMDDGFSNRKINKTTTILVFDSEKMIGNGKLLPLGPLREPFYEIKRADKIIIVNKSQKTYSIDKDLIKKFDYKDIFACNIIPGSFTVRSNKEYKNENETYLAFTGIGSPESFFNFLKDKCLVNDKIIFEDHHLYTKEDIDNIIKCAKNKKCSALITTMKDYVKIKDFNFASLPLYTLDLKIDLSIKDLINETN